MAHIFVTKEAIGRRDGFNDCAIAGLGPVRLSDLFPHHRTKTKLSGMDTLKQVEANLRYMLQDAENLSIFLIGERDIQQYLSHNEDHELDRVDILAG